MAELALGLTALVLVLTAVRIALALRHLRAAPGGEPVGAGSVDGPPHGGRGQRVTVLQPIRSGDPLLAAMLAENVVNQPDAHLLWLVDEDDPEALAVTRSLAAGAANVELLVTPAYVPGVNPKVAKLVLGLPRCGEVLAVLDDDTVLPPGALDRAVGALAHGDLVTGLPVYREQGSVWSRLVAAFVNGSALLSYPALAALAPPVTINGMFVLTRRSVLEDLGGFRAIELAVRDDYELARLYRSAGLKIVQSAVVHPLATTVAGPGAYLRILRRWLAFGGQVVARDATPALLGLVVLPTVLPLAALMAAIASGRGVVVVAVLAGLLAKALTTAVLRRRTPPAPAGALGVALEVIADLLTPVHALCAVLGPRRVSWRGRTVWLADGPRP